MPTKKNLQFDAPWVELVATQKDWDEADPKLLNTMLTQLHLIRAFEETALELASQKLVNGPLHSSIGQEGGAVGSIINLNSSDQINGSHRGHHQFLAKALGFVSPAGMDDGKVFSEEIVTVLRRSLSEICGLAEGYCGGRGGSMHLQWIEAGAMGTNAIVGGAVPFAAGFAWNHKHSKTDAVAVTYFGDGAVNIGSVLETLNLAAAWKLPICFFVENNKYGVSTTVEEATGESRLSARGPGFKIASWQVDGMDPLAVYLTMKQAVEYMRSGNGPTMIEAKVYRYFHQNGPFPGSAFGYREKSEEAEWRQRDPIQMMESHLIRRKLITDVEIKKLREKCQKVMTKVSNDLLEADPSESGKQRFKPSLWPNPAQIDEGIRGDLSEFDGVKFKEAQDFVGKTVSKKFVSTVADVMMRRMETDNSIVVMGEDVHKLNGGPRGATKGLKDAFPGRVLGTPISEAAFTGLAGGMALDGRFKPVVELMYADFIWVSADQLFNQIGKARHMFGGKHEMSLVLRIKIGTRTGYGSQHSMDPAGIMNTSPGWRIAAPSTALDYIGMMNSSLLCKDPVVVLEHDSDLYKISGEVPESDLDFYIKIGSAAVKRKGSKLTILTYLSMVQQSLDAVESSGIDAEVIDLRWLDAASIDWDTIGESIRKTNNVLIVEQGSRSTSYGGWLADEIQRRFFDWLDSPIERISGSISSPSVSFVLEEAALANKKTIENFLNLNYSKTKENL
jgi:2-oxoisovalerate dehydrogenase E1 component